jgi:nucleoside-diphosphate-sugar epimerase
VRTDSVAVTGGGGFIGHALVIDQARRGARVKSLDVTHATPLPGKIASDVERIDGSILEAEDLARAFSGAQVVFHLASAHLEVRHGESYYHSVNVDGTRKVMEAAASAGVERVVQVSTVGVYGVMEGRPFNEDSPTAPTVAYERTKLEAEGVARSDAERLGIELVIVRPSWVYGPSCRRTRKLFDTVRKGRFFMVGSGQARRDCIFIDDCLEGLELCARHASAPGETFILASGEAPSISELVTAIAEEQGVRPPRLKVPVAPMWLFCFGLETAFKLIGKDAPFSRRSLKFFSSATVFDSTKIRTVLGFAPAVALRDGVRRSAQGIRTLS